MPKVAAKKPRTQQVPAATMDLRGPTFSTQVPNREAEMPSMAMAREKIQPVATSPTSKCSASGLLNTEKA